MEYLKHLQQGIEHCIGYSQELEQYLSETYQKCYKKLTPREIDAICRYTDGDAMDENKNIINHAVKKARLPKDLVLFRGTCMTNLQNISLFKDNTFKTKELISATINPLVARNFGNMASRYQNGEPYIILEINLKENFNALWVQQFSFVSTEAEFLIKRGVTFEIIKEKEAYDEYEEKSYKILQIKPMIK